MLVKVCDTCLTVVMRVFFFKRARRYLDEQFIIKVMAQLTLALKECHRRSDGRATVLHRDLKPANIFLNIKQNVKLGDFGLARILNHDTSFAKTFVGTPYYMSPVSVETPPVSVNRLVSHLLTCSLYNYSWFGLPGANKPSVLQREVGYLVPGMFALRTVCPVVSLSHFSIDLSGCVWLDSEFNVLAATLFLSPPFTAYNQKELTEKIRAGKYRRIPYRYSEELNNLLSKMLNVKVSAGTKAVPTLYFHFRYHHDILALSISRHLY